MGASRCREAFREPKPVNGFQLKPYEDGLGGVRHQNGVLCLRPSTGALGLALFGLVLAGFLIVAAIIAGSIFFAGLWAAMAVPTVLYLPCRVVAGDGEIAVFNKWSRYKVSIEDVVGARVEEFRPALGFMPFSGPTTVWPRTLAACYVTLRDGRSIRCDSLIGLSPNDAFGPPSVIETKADILRRWIEAAHG